MRKFSTLLGCTLLLTGGIYLYTKVSPQFLHPEKESKEEGYDGPAARDALEFEKTKDPSLGYVPTFRMDEAIEITENLKLAAQTSRLSSSSMNWIERGPIYDTVGTSNGNKRAGFSYTSGRIRAVLIDTLNDPTGNTVFAGGVAGGLWKCTNFLSTEPNWQIISDFYSNMALSSICQDPTNPQVMYFATGEATSNSDAVFGNGVWKSTDAGTNWKQLPSTNKFMRNFKIDCDADGNVYLAMRTLTTPIEQPFGLVRSKDGGATWENITPSNLTSNSICPDFEISSTGKLHASFGYSGSVVNYRYTTDPATVTSSTWTTGTGIRISAVAANRIELATAGDVLYAVTTNASNNIDSCYKSVNGGATWTKQNTTVYTTGLTNTQGWYNITLAVNPMNTAEIMVGGLDAYRSTNSGATISRATYWVTTAPYVHADHHYMQWWHVNGENRILIGCDGGLFLTQNGGTNWVDKNKNLGIKQFYSGAIHPTAGSPYLLAGAQDNGSHQLKYDGLASSIEVTGGDGAYVHINQKNPQVQFTSYVYNQYRRSTNGGQTWSSVNFSSSAGLFINPFDYDDENNTMYASWSANSILRWPNANTSTSAATISLPSLGTASALKVSSNTADRVYVGSNSGKVYQVDNTSGTAVITNITGASFPAGYINCVTTGSTDDYLVAVFTNYGVNNVWYSKDGGSNWTAIDGNLPDMPVRWAIFHPQYDNRLIIATQAGVYITDAVNGSNTVWAPETQFPTVRTDMLNIRKSDNTIVAATHGRGLYTAVVSTSTVPEVNFDAETLTVKEDAATMQECRGYKDYTVGINISSAPSANAQVTVNVKSGNTAKKGIDFDYTTNGDFANITNQVTFAAGETAEKVLTVRIYDDAEVEASETFSLELATSGANTQAGAANEHAFTVEDNDKAPTVSAESFTIGTYNSDIIATSPFAGNRVKHRTQNLYTAAELRAAGINSGSSITSLTLNVVKKYSTKPFTGFTVSLAHTTATTMSSGYAAGTFTPVFNGDYTSVEGANTFNFSTPFIWDGTSNIAVQYCFDNGAGDLVQFADFVEGNSYPLGAGVRASTYANYASGTTAGCALPAALVSDYRVNATFGVNYAPKVIATAKNSTKTEYLNATNDLYYYTATGELLARVRNLSANNHGCVGVTIDRAGTGAAAFWNSNKNNMLMDKTFQISAQMGSMAKYEVTFYYTKAEKEGWEAATGQSWNEIQLVRVTGKISDVNANYGQGGTGSNLDAVNAVKGTFGNGYTLTAAFNGSFGGFGAGIPGRTSTVLVVKGTKQTEQSRIASGTAKAGMELSWTTSSENNSSVFEIEKSYDGINFHKIGTVTAAGDKATSSTYSFIDRENAEINYYRIVLLHKDKSIVSSNIIRLINEDAAQQLHVLSNPFRNDIRIRFAKAPQGKLQYQLYDISGKLLQQNTVTATGSEIVQFNINTSQLVSRGTYLLDLLVEGRHYKVKVIKE